MSSSFFSVMMSLFCGTVKPAQRFPGSSCPCSTEGRIRLKSSVRVMGLIQAAITLIAIVRRARHMRCSGSGCNIRFLQLGGVRVEGIPWGASKRAQTNTADVYDFCGWDCRCCGCTRDFQMTMNAVSRMTSGIGRQGRDSRAG